MHKIKLDVDGLHVESFCTHMAEQANAIAQITPGSFTGPCCSFDSCTGPAACACEPQIAI
jgi:hypothetical protein